MLGKNCGAVGMYINTAVVNGIAVAIIESEEKLLQDVQSALDFIVQVKYASGCDRVVLFKEAVCEAFFILSSGLAGEILQKFVNYQVKLAVVGEYSNYTSKPLKDFICESNKGKDVFFVATQQEAFEKLCRA